MLKSITFLAIALIPMGYAGAQTPSKTPDSKTYTFTKGLVALTGSRYGREAIYTDPLAYQLYSGRLKQPTEGAIFGTDEQGSDIKWLAIMADSLNRLRLRSGIRGNAGAPAGPGVVAGSLRGGIGGGGGYTYLTYSSTRE